MTPNDHAETVGDGRSGLAAYQAARLRVRESREAIARACEGLESEVDAGPGHARVKSCISDLESALSTFDDAMAAMAKAAAVEGLARDGGGASSQLLDDVAFLKRKLDEQILYRERLSSQIRQLKMQTSQARAEAEMLRGSYAFRLGGLLVAAGKRPRDLLMLPVRLLVLAREAWPRVRARLARLVARKVPDDAPDLGPDIDVASDAVEWASQAPEAAQPVKRMLLGTDSAPRLPVDPGQMRIATIMDEFSFNAFRHCGNLRQLSADDWRMEVESFSPHMLLVESAWKGQDESWSRKVYPLSRELVELVEWCRVRKIPTVFWNKEDPVHLSVFMRTARQFDFVFTTDIDCVRTYKATLGHDQVFWLPFACQPKEHNPIEEYERKDAFCFAGSFYAKYPDRQRDFAAIVDSMAALRPFDIFDRNAGKDDPALAYPDRYQPLIRGALPYERISTAYKGYRYGININTVKQSQSMFARRVFDLLASNTVTISNYSRGLRNLLGDLVISSDSGRELRRRVEPLLDNEREYRKFRLAGLRKVMSEHTYQDRLRYVLEMVGARPLGDGMPEIIVASRAGDREELASVSDAFRRQAYGRKRLRIVVPDGLAQNPPHAAPEGVELIAESDAARIQVRDVGGDAWIAWFDPADHYGKNYLTDLAVATRYSSAAAIGKAAYHELDEGAARLVAPELAYRPGRSIPLRRAMARAHAIPAMDLLSFANGAAEMVVRDACGIDEFNYCLGGARAGVDSVDDAAGIWTGIPQARLHGMAESATALDLQDAEASASPILGAEALADLLPLGKEGDQRVSLRLDGDQLGLASSLPGDKHVYLYANKPLPIGQLFAEEIGKFNLVVDSEMLISFVLIYLDEQRQRIGHAIRACSSNLSISPPSGTRYVRLGLRVQGPGTAAIKRLVLGHVRSAAAGIPACGSHLVVARGYPSYDNLYNYAYVHRRVLGYAGAGTRVDVFRLAEDAVAFGEFEGVDVVSGRLSDLETMIRSNPYGKVLVHSLDRALWSVLKACAFDREILIWVHGAEAQPWYRRDFSFLDQRDRERGMQRSNDRMAFWTELLSTPPDNARFIFVSEHLRREVLRDTGVELDRSRYEVIHNHVDGDLFRHVEKDPGQRHRLLSIRPYDRPTYANDLTVKAILDLVEEPFFPELRFRLVGDGRLFDQTVEPVLHLSNVAVEKRFLQQEEIAALHREHGVFLCPSRIDSQGVSRDEAMASGLVPVTNRVSAIPEFVDEQSAMLVAPEDWRGMADAIRRLHARPDIFLRMSKAAADRVRLQSGRGRTLLRELEMIESPVRRQPAVPATTIPRRPRIAVYGDLDVNIVDGSSVWAASVAKVLALDDDADVDFFLKAPIQNTQVLRELLPLVNVRLVEPLQGVARRQPGDAVDAILAEDVRRNYDAVLLRGFDLATEAVARPSLKGRLLLYLTDIPTERDVEPALRSRLQEACQGARLLLCQTPQLARHLADLAPVAAGKTRLLPPMLPPCGPFAPGATRAPGQPLRIAYAGKFAPLWGIRELFAASARLREEGHAVELHVYGDKIHNPPDDPAFRGDILAALRETEGVFWHGTMDRASVLEQLRNMHVGWAWRRPELELPTLELSTKLLEYAACGIPPIVAPGPVNLGLLGADYPLFAAGDALADLLRTLVLDAGTLDRARAGLAGIADRYAYAAVRSRHVAPLIGEVAADAAGFRQSSQEADA